MTYTPTTDEVEHRYAYDELYSMDCEADHRAFRRWLKAHDAEVAAQALGDAADVLEAMLGEHGPGNRNTGYGQAGLALLARIRDRADRIERGE